MGTNQDFFITIRQGSAVSVTRRPIEDPSACAILLLMFRSFSHSFYSIHHHRAFGKWRVLYALYALYILIGALLSFLDLLATSFPGAMNRASFRGLATELRRDPGLNDIAR